MAIKKWVEYWPECDKCGVRHELFGQTPKEGWTIAKTKPWRVVGTVILCPDCYRSAEKARGEQG